MATLRIDNLGQYGVMPDVEPAALPLNAFSMANNWIFHDGNFAEIAQGYSNALAALEDDTLGDADTNATFIYPWILSNNNAVIYYDDNDDRHHLIESYRFETTLATAATSASTSLVLTNAANFADSGNGFFETNAGGVISTFTWTGKTGNTLTGVDIEETGFSFPIGETVVDISDDVSDFTLSRFDHDTAGTHRWQATDAFGLPILNNGEEAPLTYVERTGETAVLDPLFNWPENATASFITKSSAFLIAVGYRDPDNSDVSLRGGRRTIAISDVIQSAGDYPNWDFNAADYTGHIPTAADSNATGTISTTAGTFSQLFDLSLYTDGDLVTAVELNNILYVFTTTNIVAFVYEGEGIWNATVLPTPNGAINNRSVTIIPNGFFVIGNNRMYIFDGSTVNIVGEGKWVESWFNGVDESRLNEVQCIYDPRNEAVKIKTPRTGSIQEMWIYNLSKDTLSIQDDHNEVAYMLFSPCGVPTRQATWDNLPGTWDDLAEDDWDAFPVLGLGDFRNRILSCGGNNIFVHDQGDTYNTRVIMSTLQRQDIQLGDSAYDSVQATRVVLHVSSDENDSEVFVRLGGSEGANTNLSFQNYQRHAIETTTKTDWRFSTKWLAYTIQTADAGIKLSGVEIQVQPHGRR